MDNTAILSHLEALAESMDIQIRYERLESETSFSTGGLCRIRDKQVIIVNESASLSEKARTLARALKRFDLSRMYIKPALRDFLETAVQEK